VFLAEKRARKIPRRDPSTQVATVGTAESQESASGKGVSWWATAAHAIIIVQPRRMPRLRRFQEKLCEQTGRMDMGYCQGLPQGVAAGGSVASMQFSWPRG
jgi:hypothetical protein